MNSKAYNQSDSNFIINSIFYIVSSDSPKYIISDIYWFFIKFYNNSGNNSAIKILKISGIAFVWLESENSFISKERSYFFIKFLPILFKDYCKSIKSI